MTDSPSADIRYLRRDGHPTLAYRFTDGPAGANRNDGTWGCRRARGAGDGSGAASKGRGDGCRGRCGCRSGAVSSGFAGACCTKAASSCGSSRTAGCSWSSRPGCPPGGEAGTAGQNGSSGEHGDCAQLAAEGDAKGEL